MSIRSKTTRTELDMATFANENEIPLPNLDYTVNSSGMLTIFYNAADAVQGTTVFGTDAATGATASEATYAAAITAGDYSARINSANATKIGIYLTVVVGNATALRMGVRSSKLGDPDVATATDWYQNITDDNSSSSGLHTFNEVEIEIVSSLMAVTGAQYYFEFPVRSNWTSLVLYGGGSYEVTLVVEPIA